jgi:hypothetical protein
MHVRSLTCFGQGDTHLDTVNKPIIKTKKGKKMSGYQFIHVETYARIASKNSKKQSARGIAAEAERAPSASRHIEEPKPYKQMFGCTPSEAVALAETRAHKAKDKQGRKLRKDAQIILAGVISYPIPTSQLTPNDPNLNKWLKLSHEFLLKKHGQQYKSCVLHYDEAYIHCHYLLIPELKEDNLFQISDVHQGIAARNAAKTNTAKDKMRAYKIAMREFQEEYYDSVGIKCGLTKNGPKRRRLTRKQWQIEKASAQHQSEAFDNIKLAESSLYASQLKQDELEQSKKELEEIKSLVEAAHAKAKKEINKLITIKLKGDKGIVSLLTNQVNKLKDNTSKLVSKVKNLQFSNTRLHNEVAVFKKETKKLRAENFKINYQNDLRFKGIKQLKSELFYVLELAKSGQLKKISEISNNHNNHNKQEHQS